MMRLQGALVLGGGPAGAAAAIWLARAGRPVTLWERERLPSHKPCSEFLTPDAQAYLADLGLDLAALGAVPADRLRLVTARRTVEAGLGFTARAVTRRVLDAALLDCAAAAGVSVQRGEIARELSAEGAVIAGHGAVRPDTLLLATGRRALRGAGWEGAPTQTNAQGFKTYLRLVPSERAALAGHVELMLTRDALVRLQMVERDMANLSLLVSAERWQAGGGSFAELLAALVVELPHLAARLAGAVPLLDRPLPIAGVPYGYLHRPAPGDTVWRLGDQAAIVPSFAGDGIGLALHGARLATAALLTGQTPQACARRLAADAGGALRRAAWLQRMTARADLDRLALLPGAVRLAAGLGRLPARAVRRGRAI